MPLGQWISAPWNRLAGLVAAVGIGIAVAAFVRFRQIGTTVNPVDPSKATRLVADGVFRFSRNPEKHCARTIGADSHVHALHKAFVISHYAPRIY